MKISSMLSHLGVRGNERLSIASPNHMHPSPRGPNFSGNGFGPWNGMHPEVFGLATKIIMPSSVVSSTALSLCSINSMLNV
jgi:hypothetical protein